MTTNGRASRTPPSSGRGLLSRVAGVATERVVETVDLDIVLNHVDVNLLLDRIDVQRVLDRIDANSLLDQVDLQRLLERVDLNAVLAGVDLEELVRRSGVPDIIVASTGKMATSTLDLARRQIVGLDAVTGRGVDRVLRRRPAPEDAAPPALRMEDDLGRPRATVSGHYAGPVSRGLAALTDMGVVVGSFAVGLAGLDFLLGALFGWGGSNGSSPLAAATLVVWGVLYSFGFVAVAGQTLGKRLLGLKVVRTEGGVVSGRRAFVRGLTYPVCVALMALCFLPILLGRRHRGLSDWAAGTVVVIDWGDRPAELPAPLSAFLRRSHLSEPARGLDG